MIQFDWIKRQAKRHKRLMALREVIELELQRQLPFSETSIRITLLMIRRIYGEKEEEETRRLFGLDEQAAA